MLPSKSVSDAVATRRSVRAFLPTDVDEALIRRVLAQASWAPSGGNLQPWQLIALKNEPLEALKAIMRQRLIDKPNGETEDGEAVDFKIYPSPLEGVDRERRLAMGVALYEALGISKDDAVARRAWHHRNFDFFGAPVALFFYVNRKHNGPQWADIGMYMQSLMLLLREHGLDSCPQEAWARYAHTVNAFLKPSPDWILYCGFAIGYADDQHPVNRFERARAGVDEFASFRGFRND